MRAGQSESSRPRRRKRRPRKAGSTLSKLAQLCRGFEDVIWEGRIAAQWAREIEAIEQAGADYALHIYPAARAFFRTHRRRRDRDGVWAPIHTLRHPGIIERIERAKRQTREISSC
jgi:hypothetical protein